MKIHRYTIPMYTLFMLCILNMRQLCADPYADELEGLSPVLQTMHAREEPVHEKAIEEEAPEGSIPAMPSFTFEKHFDQPAVQPFATAQPAETQWATFGPKPLSKPFEQPFTKRPPMKLNLNLFTKQNMRGRQRQGINVGGDITTITTGQDAQVGFTSKGAQIQTHQAQQLQQRLKQNEQDTRERE